ncbi:hypothetical protein [Streptomyces roseochromogenus]|uniref:hypothetical protein n=1 Tax=Streptomyces roseochromogenus TaxID=285450 RepID=UPI00099775F1|nr:hypothetical protein [Streptomyces roseochromogenus]
MAVELGHQLAVRGTGGGKVVVRLLDREFQVDHLLFEGADPGLELFGVAQFSRNRPRITVAQIDTGHRMGLRAPEAVATLITRFVRGLPG